MPLQIKTPRRTSASKGPYLPGWATSFLGLVFLDFVPDGEIPDVALLILELNHEEPQGILLTSVNIVFIILIELCRLDVVIRL